MWSLRFFGLALQLFLAVLGGIDAGSNEISPALHVHVWTKFVYPNKTFPDVSTRIHGGTFAEKNAFPYAAFILAFEKNDFKRRVLACTGSIVDENWVLTAAHCALPREKPPGIIVVAGRPNLQTYYALRINVPFDLDVNGTALGIQERRVLEVHMHPDYTTPENGHDLVLLRLNKPFEMNDAVKTLPLSERKMSSRLSCTVLGWGLNEYDYQSFKLMYAEPVYAQTPEIDCTHMESGPFICLEKGGGGICRGDSGSPLVCGDRIWGVASFAVSYSQNPSCLDQEEEYFCQVYPDLKWIRKVLSGAGTSLTVKHIAFFFAFVIWAFV